MLSIKVFNKYRQVPLLCSHIKLLKGLGKHKLLFIDKNNFEYTCTGSVNKFLQTKYGKNLVWVNKGVAINSSYLDTSQPFDEFYICLYEYEKIKVAEKLAREIKKIAKKKKNLTWSQLLFRKGRRVRVLGIGDY